MSTDLEKYLRDDLRAVARDVDVPLTVDAVLDAIARARTRQRVLRLALSALAIALASALWWAAGLGRPADDRAVPDPLQRPTASAAPTASPGGTPTPAAPVGTTLMVAPDDVLRPGEPPFVRATLRADGRTVDFVAADGDGPVGAAEALELSDDANAVFASGFPRAGYVVALLRGEATWLEPVQTGRAEVLWDWASSGLEGAGLEVIAIRYRDPADAHVPELLWADAAGVVRDSERRTIPSATFVGPAGQQRTFFVDDKLDVAGVVSPTPDGDQSLVRIARPAAGPGQGVRFQMAVAELGERRYFVGGVLPAGATTLTATLDADVTVAIPLATAATSVGDDLLFYGEWTAAPGEQFPQPVDVRHTGADGVEVVWDVWER